MGSVVSHLSGTPDQEGSAVTQPVLGVAVKPAPVSPVVQVQGQLLSHSDPLHLPNPTSNAVNGSIDMVPQVLTSLSVPRFSAKRLCREHLLLHLLPPPGLCRRGCNWVVKLFKVKTLGYCYACHNSGFLFFCLWVFRVTGIG